MLQPLFESLRLDAQNRLRAGTQLLVIRWNERVGRDVPRQHSLAQRLVKGNNLKAGDRVITRRAVPLVHEPLHVDLGDCQGSTRKRLIFCKNRPIFRNQMVP